LTSFYLVPARKDLCRLLVFFPIIQMYYKPSFSSLEACLIICPNNESLVFIVSSQGSNKVRNHSFRDSKFSLRNEV